MSRVFLVTAMLVLFASAPLAARDQGEDGDEPDFVDELFHSDVPLYTFEWEHLWPRSFHDEDSFGCLSRVHFGDWEFKPDPANEHGESYWYRFQNYGVFHCAANLRSANVRGELGEGEFSRGFFVRMGESKLGTENWELWTFQQGMIPGSDYMLLARLPGKEDIIRSFRVLQRRCPEGHFRKVEGLDVWSTGYCAINSQAELLGLAQEMLRLLPLGILEHVGDSPDEEVTAEKN